MIAMGMGAAVGGGVGFVASKEAVQTAKAKEGAADLLYGVPVVGAAAGVGTGLLALALEFGSSWDGGSGGGGVRAAGVAVGLIGGSVIGALSG